MEHRSFNDLNTILATRSTETHEALAFRFLGDTAGPATLTYGELARSARMIAARLRDEHPAGERVLLLFPPGLEFIQAFWGCMIAGAIAVPAPAPNPLKPTASLQRLVSVVESARPTIALTLSSVLDRVSEVVEEVPAFRGVSWCATDRMDTKDETWPAIAPASPGDIAMIQYTSGSTSTPKGVTLTHGNLAHNIAWFDHGWDHRSDDVLLNWLPAFHDLGLVYGILAPVWAGLPSVQMSPVDVIQRPAVWLRAISDFRATHSCGPNFIYDLCARKVGAADCLGLDLSTWRVALTAAEPVRAETMERFARRFAAVGFSARAFSAGYGLSEGTCKVVAMTASEEPTVLKVRADALERNVVELVVDDAPARAVVGCGRPGEGASVAIVDPETCARLGDNQVGEVWVAGPGVAHSYWEMPDETRALLRATIAQGDGTPYLRTGDLGFMREGQLFITGRIKDVIIVRGANHYPQDIEYTVQEAHPCVRPGCVAAFSYDEDGEERLAIVAELDRRRDDRSHSQGRARTKALDVSDVIAMIVRAVATEHGLRAHRVALIRAGTLPKTTSGKVQRSACKRALFERTLEVIADESGESQAAVNWIRNELRARLLDVVSTVSAIPKERVRPEQSLHSFGVDSLAGVNIAYEIGLMTGHDVPSELLVEHDTIEKLVDYVISIGGAR